MRGFQSWRRRRREWEGWWWWWGGGADHGSAAAVGAEIVQLFLALACPERSETLLQIDLPIHRADFMVRPFFRPAEAARPARIPL